MNLLTDKEKALAADASVMLAKNKIIQEVYDLFGRLAEVYQQQAAGLPDEVKRIHPKISRGENYLGLPWVMLDYPRAFSPTDTFAIRTMFWWGHCFSVHLLLQGNKMQLLKREGLEKGWFFSTAADPWQHRYEAENAIPAESVTSVEPEKQAQNGFYKLSCYLPLQEWDDADVFLMEKFREALQMINGSKE